MASFEEALKELEINNVDTAIGILEKLVLIRLNHPQALLAACKLGDIFHEGLGGHKDDILAAKWYFKAANKQYGEAQYMLGEFFKNGWGVPQNLCEAHKYYNLAVMNGYDDALNARNKLANLISPERVAQAEDLAWQLVKELYRNIPENDTRPR